MLKSWASKRVVVIVVEPTHTKLGRAHRCSALKLQSVIVISAKSIIDWLLLTLNAESHVTGAHTEL